jgi:enediyne biosynthesis protein E4
MRLIPICVAWLSLSVLALADPVIPTYAEETASAGINSTYTGEWEYMVGGGVATFDCNSDGFADMFLAGGTSPAKFYRNTSRRGRALHFEKQMRGLIRSTSTVMALLIWCCCVLAKTW